MYGSAYGLPVLVEVRKQKAYKTYPICTMIIQSPVYKYNTVHSHWLAA